VVSTIKRYAPESFSECKPTGDGNVVKVGRKSVPGGWTGVKETTFSKCSSCSWQNVNRRASRPQPLSATPLAAKTVVLWCLSDVDVVHDRALKWSQIARLSTSTSQAQTNLAAGTDANCCDEHVCLYVHEHIPGITFPNFTKFSLCKVCIMQSGVIFLADRRLLLVVPLAHCVVCLSSVTFCIVAKWYVLAKNCLE